MVQVAFGGLIPFFILKAPHYPLVHTNMILYASMTIINMLFLVSSMFQFLGLFLIKVIFIVLLYVYNEQKVYHSDIII